MEVQRPWRRTWQWLHRDQIRADRSVSRGFCGVVGLLPTYGRASRYGLIAFASSLDHIGPDENGQRCGHPAARHGGRDELDSTSAEAPVADYEAKIGKSAKGLRLGVPKNILARDSIRKFGAAVEAAIQKLAELVRDRAYLVAAHRIRDPDLLHHATAEASANLACFDGVRYGYRSLRAHMLSEMYRRRSR